MTDLMREQYDVCKAEFLAELLLFYDADRELVILPISNQLETIWFR